MFDAGHHCLSPKNVSVLAAMSMVAGWVPSQRRGTLSPHSSLRIPHDAPRS